jgi:hypothetical protein
MTLSIMAGTVRMSWAIATGAARFHTMAGGAGWLLWNAALCTLFVTTIFAIRRGQPWSRWVGLALIVAFLVYDILKPGDHYPNDAERAGAEMSRYIFIPALCVWWAWAFAFTAKATAYFARRPSDLE